MMIISICNQNSNKNNDNNKTKCYANPRLSVMVPVCLAGGRDIGMTCVCVFMTKRARVGVCVHVCGSVFVFVRFMSKRVSELNTTKWKSEVKRNKGA